MDIDHPSSFVARGAIMSGELSAIERQLAGAAELHFTGALNEELYMSTLRGALAMLPMLEAPGHIAVLKRLKQWKDDELIPLRVYEQLCQAVVAASHGPTAGAGSSVQTTEQRPAQCPAPAKRKANALEAAPPAKTQKKAAVQQKTTLFSVLPGATKTLIKASELREQREAAARDEDYVPEQHDLRHFRQELQPEPAPAVVKEYSCSKCARKFSTQIGLRNHESSHTVAAKPKEFFAPVEEVPFTPATVSLDIDSDGQATISFLLDGLTIEQIEADEQAARTAMQERETQRRAEAMRRVRIREAEAEAEKGEHRKGSRVRKQYTPKQKVAILEVFDKICGDPTITRKVETFEKDPRAFGTPYTTVRADWSHPEQRAKIYAAAGREHAASLLRIDTTTRKKGKYEAMERELFARFKARRARGRKVSARWLTAMGRQLMQALHPAEAASFKGGKSWRRRFALRFKIGLRRKTNVKNKTWAETEPVLLRYFRSLRKRLQLEDNDEALTSAEDDGEEPEPEDINPPFEEDEERQAGEDALDSDDDAEADDVLVTLEAAMPSGFKVAAAPSAEQLEFKSAQAQELVGQLIVFNWAAVGWCKGNITSANTDGRVKMKIGDVMKTVNFRAEYEDESEAKHVLSLDNYGVGALTEDGKWVLLEPI